MVSEVRQIRQDANHANHANPVSQVSKASKKTIRRKDPISYSSWISEVVYAPSSPTSKTGYLAIAAYGGEVILYRDIPSQLVGLMQAGLGGLSVGKAYHRLIRNKMVKVDGKMVKAYVGQTLEGEEAKECLRVIRELKEKIG